ncbi:MAG: type II toxin-antitoxin system PemK/MazF family toxin [Candidatus Riesia sp.]|nr:type II toxin-antitoxin system PemK/MazF family toxin [Candidatus Riesia sp.]
MYSKRLNQWEVVGVELGSAEIDLVEDSYSRNEIIDDMNGVNLGAEMARFHRCVVLLEAKFNAGDSVLIAPFSSYKKGDENINAVLVVDHEDSTRKFISRRSTLQLSRLRSVSRKRITRHYGYLPRSYSRKVIGKIKGLITGVI